MIFLSKRNGRRNIFLQNSKLSGKNEMIQSEILSSFYTKSIYLLRKIHPGKIAIY